MCFDSKYLINYAEVSEIAVVNGGQCKSGTAINSYTAFSISDLPPLIAQLMHTVLLNRFFGCLTSKAMDWDGEMGGDVCGQ